MKNKMLSKIVILFAVIFSINSFAQIPTITGFSPISAKPGEIVTINGTGFHLSSDSNLVYFGTVKGLVIASTNSQILARVPLGSSYGPICLHTRNYTAYSTLSFIPTFDGASTNLNSFSQNIDFVASQGACSKLLVADLNTDGKPDIIKFPGINGTNSISVFENQATPSLFNDTSLKAEKLIVNLGYDTTFVDMLVTDFNHDSLMDIVILSLYSNVYEFVCLSFYENRSNSDSISFAFYNCKIINDAALISPCGGPIVYTYSNLEKGILKMTDLNFDAVPDYIVSLDWYNSVCSGTTLQYKTQMFGIVGVYSNVGSLQFNIEYLQTTSANSKTTTFVAGNLNNDNKPDIVHSFFSASTNFNNANLRTNTNLLGGTITTWIDNFFNNQASLQYEDIFLEDIDKDQKLDIIRTLYGKIYKNIHVAGNLLSSSFAPVVTLSINDASQNVVFSDINGDTKPDLVSIKNATNSVTVTQNNTSPGNIQYANFATTEFVVFGGSPFIVAVNDLDGDMKPELITSNGNSKLSVFKNLITAEFILDTSLCANTNDTITYTGTAGTGAIFLWDFDGATVVSGTGSGPIVVNWQNGGQKIVSLTVNEGGNITNISKNVSVFNVPTSTFITPPFIYINDTNTISYSGSGNLTANYYWNFDGGSIINGSGQGPYDVKWTIGGNRLLSLYVEENGCYSDTTEMLVTIFSVYQEERICVVTVDPISGKNMIVWEKTAGENISSYNIYKEVATNFYSWIGNIPFADMSTFIDVNSSPAVHPDKYKLSILDSNGSESLKSPYQKTIHLQASAGIPNTNINLSWTPYFDEEGTFIPSKYYIYRGSLPTNLALLDSVSGSYTTYTDVNVFSAYYYMVGVERLGGCNPTLFKTVFNGSFSNIKENGITTVANTSFKDDFMIIYPNPFSDFTTILITDFNFSNFNSPIVISDVTGKIIREIAIPNNQSLMQSNFQIKIDKGDLKPGIYFVEVNSNKLYRGKLIVQ